MAYIANVAERKKTPVSKPYADKFCNEILSRMPEICITKVEAVKNNKFLHAAFQLRKAQHEVTRGFCPTEDLYHATARDNVASILKDNLDWRRVQRSRFGKGVSFSSYPEYADKFCNEKNGALRAFIICAVLTGNELEVNQNYSPYPREDIDTYRSKSNMVVVKFEDNTFYPRLVIYYQTSSLGSIHSIRSYVGFDSESDNEGGPGFSRTAYCVSAWIAQ